MGSERRERTKVLGARLRELRAEAGLTGAVLARRAGVGQPTVSKVETGRMVPSADVLDRLSRAPGLDESTAGESGNSWPRWRLRPTLTNWRAALLRSA
ncbi:helix-turn-helix transcriptional regulator [Streptomyces griseoflavus]|uniref:helix-turn-helix domain-containing protein n=1 Tax=Streptomyces griseoflavus TaxID=35619 RepID=UPI0033AE1EB4